MPPGQASRVPPPHGRLVLVVEDEFLIALDLEQLLRRHGWRVLGPTAAALAGAPAVSKPTDERRLLAALARAVAP